MAAGPASAVADGIIALLANGTSYTAGNGPLWIQLAIGDPGTAGTSNPAGNTVRQACGTFSGSGGNWSNTTTITWTSVSTTETYTFFTLWTASSGGTFIGSGTVTGGGVTAGNTFQIPASDLTFQISPAS